MNYADAVTRMNAVQMAIYGDPASYTPPGGSSIPVSVIMNYGKNPSDQRTAMQAEASAYVLESEVPDPEYKAVITIGGVAWTVFDKTGSNAGYWQLNLRRDLRATFKR